MHEISLPQVPIKKQWPRSVEYGQCDGLCS